MRYMYWIIIVLVIGLFIKYIKRKDYRYTYFSKQYLCGRYDYNINIDHFKI